MAQCLIRLNAVLQIIFCLCFLSFKKCHLYLEGFMRCVFSPLSCLFRHSCFMGLIPPTSPSCPHKRTRAHTLDEDISLWQDNRCKRINNERRNKVGKLKKTPSLCGDCKGKSSRFHHNGFIHSFGPYWLCLARRRGAAAPTNCSPPPKTTAFPQSHFDCTPAWLREWKLKPRLFPTPSSAEHNGL